MLGCAQSLQLHSIFGRVFCGNSWCFVVSRPWHGRQEETGPGCINRVTTLVPTTPCPMDSPKSVTPSCDQSQNSDWVGWDWYWAAENFPSEIPGNPFHFFVPQVPLHLFLFLFLSGLTDMEAVIPTKTFSLLSCSFWWRHNLKLLWWKCKHNHFV